MKDLFINGIGVGKDPSLIHRDFLYKNNFDKIGGDKKNIIHIKKFISDEECFNILNVAFSSIPEKILGNDQWSEKLYKTDDLVFTLEILNKIKNKIIEIYKINVKNSHDIPFVTRWSSGDSMSMHVDDLGTPQNHISAVIYLNENYDGGEIFFPTHNLKIKPGTGDLVVFPGNLNYPHQVEKIINGDRYTLPSWFSFVDELEN